MASPIGSPPPSGGPAGPAGSPGPAGPGGSPGPAVPGGSAEPPIPRPGPGAPRPAAGPERGGTPVTLPEGWVGNVTDRIVSTVDSVRAKTTVPIEKIGRVVIWGLLIATAGVSVLIVLVIGGLRLLYEAVGNIPGIEGKQGRSVWMIDVLFGVVLILLGLFFIKKGTRPQREDRRA